MNKPLHAVAVAIALASTPVHAAPKAASKAKFHLEEATIADIQKAILGKQITTEELVTLYLKRIKAYNGVCVNQPDGLLGKITTIPKAGQLNALSTLNLRPATRKQWGFDERKARSMTNTVDDDPTLPDALETASAQDAALKNTGKLVGPLHGVVLSVKDQYDTIDLRTTSGADAHYANDRPPDDATFIARLRAAGAIILAKSNMAEYASNGSRSAFGGVACNPYDTERVPGMSSSGSATSVAANLVTCAIAEETGPSIRWPALANNTIGLSPTQELVSRDGMIGAGLNTRTGPICRTVEDSAKVLDVIAGWDPKDELTAFSVGRLPPRPYASYATEKSLKGLRIGVVREYMNKMLFSKADEQTIDIIDREIGKLKALGATVVDPGAEGALFQGCITRLAPGLYNASFAKQFPQLFPAGKNQVMVLADMGADTAKVPAELTLRSLGPARAEGEGKYYMERYLRERGDASIRTHADLISKATFYNDSNFPDRKKTRETAEAATVYDNAVRLQHRFAVQTIVMQCMQEQKLDALVYPTNNVPPPKLDAPNEPAINGRSALGWTLMGAQGFPAITVPAGFTTEVYDRVRDPDAPLPSQGQGTATPGAAAPERTRLVGPVAAVLPVGIDFMARPFDEPLLLRIASAYEAASRHRRPPQGFGPLVGEP